MNNLLSLNKKFQTSKKENNGFGSQTNTFQKEGIKLSTISEFVKELKEIKAFWQNITYLNGNLLITVYEKTIIAKTNRIHRLFSFNKEDSNKLIVGARFYFFQKARSHAFTYLLSKSNLDTSISLLEYYCSIFKKTFGNMALQLDINQKAKIKIPENTGLSFSDFYQITHELSFINRFDIYKCDNTINDPSVLVTLFDTNTKIEDVFKKLNISFSSINSIDENTVLLTKDNYDLLLTKAPYLVSMSIKDFAKSVKDNEKHQISSFIEPILPSPDKFPTIGVIDTPFDTTAYFSNFVTNNYMIDPNINVEKEDFKHGTEIDSLIVDLPDLDPQLDDGCGYFKVRHFGIAKATSNSIFTIIQKIKSIVINNLDIHVWNLSLGTVEEIQEDCISPVAALLDELQSKYNIIFVVAGTNKSDEEKKEKHIGSPADSINSIVVNSVNSNNEPVSYSRVGPVLGFFIKPDISYYGGDSSNPIYVYYDRARITSWGTSFAAPLIARKLCYLIDVLNIDRESAKALLINSAIHFVDNENLDMRSMGYGVVPIKIQDIVEAKDDEIRFIIRGQSKKYYTYDYSLPIPVDNNKFPYSVKATFCYFPSCNRKQGVDYTGTELEFKLGKVSKDKKIVLNEDDIFKSNSYISEDESRKTFRKWDNVKNRKSKFSSKSGLKANPNDTWGIRISYYDRTLSRDSNGELPIINWGLVVTLKAVDQKNRYDSFINDCSIRQWLVTPISIEERITIYNQMEEKIHFDN